MPIGSEAELERAVQVYQRFSQGPAQPSDETPVGKQRQTLDADIKAYYAKCSDAMKPARQPRT